ncbi:hypothetical protein H257_00955 [Aphanomyces astaci]|uniref:Uncharacterized protein n=1 Tax=Aphanomyces astaci TaxID=112090 RepID=W4H5Q2_APHAT|nr:hypothetical protein H257_00955 [Aphanomyces astaci]ETV87345.1 hypothetical protein H257_00955 [Aphanomyces astaci]|eukprot:XP_009822208.1 hypothetical protein H257_00955 [Aphanomyces astaci]
MKLYASSSPVWLFQPGFSTWRRPLGDHDLCCVMFSSTFLNELYDRWNPLLYFNTNLVAKNIHRYCAAINSRGAPTSRVFGCIDGTKLQVCRIGPTGNGDNLQKEIYSGHKRMHCLNYQAVTAPDGLCIHFFGPVEGRRHHTT